jgi:undecaprenyl-diphosphatase
MTGLEAAALAAVQGLTEFLPVSSSGHLALASAFMDITDGGIAFDILLHLGTLLAVVVFYRKDIASIATGVHRKDGRSIRFVLLLALATVPVALAGMFLSDAVKEVSRSIPFVSAALVFTGAVLYATGWASRSGDGTVSPRSGLIVGLAQAIAIFPGVSRSGMTIGTGLFMGLDREEAARFSFLLAIPAVAGAAVKELPDAQWAVSPWVLLTGFFVSAVTGFLALSILVRFVRRGKLRGFAWYCWSAALLGLFLHLAR